MRNQLCEGNQRRNVTPEVRFKWDDRRYRGISRSGERVLQQTSEHIETEVLQPTAPCSEADCMEIRKAVERLRESQALRGCRRLVQLLRFVVEATLTGEAVHLKETTIGVFVFGRSPDYDPRVDTIVRSQAWRLRAKLRKYYASEGANDPVVIDLPIGHYVPTFRLRYSHE